MVHPRTKVDEESEWSGDAVCTQQNSNKVRAAPAKTLRWSQKRTTKNSGLVNPRLRAAIVPGCKASDQACTLDRIGR